MVKLILFKCLTDPPNFSQLLLSPIIKAINNSTLPLIAAINCSSKLTKYWRFRNPFRRPLPRRSYGISTVIILKS